MKFSKNIFFPRKNKLVIALKSYIMQSGNSHLQRYYKNVDDIACFICDMQSEKDDDYSKLADYIKQWEDSFAV